MERSALSMFMFVSSWFVFIRLSVANEYSIYHFCIVIKDHFFFKMDNCQDFTTVTFNVLFVHKPTFSGSKLLFVECFKALFWKSSHYSS